VKAVESPEDLKRRFEWIRSTVSQLWAKYDGVAQAVGPEPAGLSSRTKSNQAYLSVIVQVSGRKNQNPSLISLIFLPSSKTPSAFLSEGIRCSLSSIRRRSSRSGIQRNQNIEKLYNLGMDRGPRWSLPSPPRPPCTAGGGPPSRKQIARVGTDTPTRFSCVHQGASVAHTSRSCASRVRRRGGRVLSVQAMFCSSHISTAPTHRTCWNHSSQKRLFDETLTKR